MADQCDEISCKHLTVYQVIETNCSDGIDNDCDGHVDSGPGCVTG